jgi:predicted transcriptional regulator
MLLRDRPLLQDRIDAAIYLPRPELENPLIKALSQERNALLVGPAGSGKTTLLRRVEAAIEESGRRTVWVNAALAADAVSFLGEVEEVLRNPEPELGGIEPPHPPPRPPGLLPAVRAIAAQQPATIIVDSLADEDLGFDLFGRLRDELWAARHVWLVAVTPPVSAILRTPPAAAFWSKVVEIPPLESAEVRELLKRGLDRKEWNRMKGISPPSELHVRAVIREVERILEGDGGTDQRMGALIENAGRIGRSEATAMSELIGLGRPASVHDNELLDRLDWSRAYAQRIFANLEAADLVRSIPDSSRERSGRPRKLYEPNPRSPQ